MPISLSDSQMACVKDIAAQFVPPQSRGLYLEMVAELLHGQPIEDSTVARVARRAANEMRRRKPGRLTARI
jgi:hypothetical protein